MSIVQTAATIDHMVGKEQRFQISANTSQWSAVVITNRLGWWQRRALQSLYEISSLPENWDSYGSRPPTENAVECAKRLIIQIDRDNFLQPRIIPISGGGVQLAWHSGVRELEIEISTSGFIVEYLKSERGEPLDDGLLEIEDRSRIDTFLSWLIA